MNELWAWGSLLLSFVAILSSAIAIAHVVLKKRGPRQAWLWIIIIFLFPLLGPILYWLLGIERIPRKLTFKREFDRRLRRALAEVAARGEGTRSRPCSPLDEVLGSVLDRLTPYRPVGGNRCRVLENGEEAFPAILEAIGEATDHIHLETYIFRDDRIGRRIGDALKEKARSGVKVRVLYDAIGCYTTSSRFFAEMEAEGAVCRPFAPLTFWTWKWRPNFRNHRKLLIVDGRVGFTGSMNIGDEYHFSADDPLPYRDIHLRVEGPAVKQLQAVFCEDFHFVTGENLVDANTFPPARPVGSEVLRLLPSGPDEDHEILYHVFFHAFTQARRTIRVLTPYFIPDAVIRMALLSATLRGVDVELLLPERSDSRIVDLAGRNYVRELVSVGARVGYVPPPMVHAKLLIVDESWATLGSGNVDQRSFFLNYEANLAVSSCELVERLLEAYEKDRRRARFVSGAELPHGLAIRAVEKVSALFSPLL